MKYAAATSVILFILLLLFLAEAIIPQLVQSLLRLPI